MIILEDQRTYSWDTINFFPPSHLFHELPKEGKWNPRQQSQCNRLIICARVTRSEEDLMIETKVLVWKAIGMRQRKKGGKNNLKTFIRIQHDIYRKQSLHLQPETNINWEKYFQITDF